MNVMEQRTANDTYWLTVSDDGWLNVHAFAARVTLTRMTADGVPFEQCEPAWGHMPCWVEAAARLAAAQTPLIRACHAGEETYFVSYPARGQREAEITPVADLQREILNLGFGAHQVRETFRALDAHTHDRLA